MGLEEQIASKMKEALKGKDKVALESLRAIKSGILLAKTQKGAGSDISETQEVQLLQKMVKQRKDSAAIFQEQGRGDLAEAELAQVAVIEQFLPEQMSEADIEEAVEAVISSTGASGMQDMGKVMGIVTQKLAGKADGKTIAGIVRKKLS